MNITDNLTRIKQGKESIITALQNKGSDIKNDTLINEISTYVDKLEIGGDTPVQPETPELVQKYEGATVFRINVPNDNYEFAINLCNSTTATYDVDWGDGVLESGLTTDEQHHTYSKAGIYDVNVYNISKNITLGGSYDIQLGFNSSDKITIYYLFNNTNNDYWGVYRYIVNKDDICTNILIGKGVTIIGSYAFYGCSSLQSVVIPEGVTKIGSSAFDNCSSLQSVVIPEGVTSIGSSAFYGCSSLQSVVIPEGVTKIDVYVFKDCSSLQSVVIPEGVTSIGSSAFDNCSSLQSVVIPEGVTKIDGYAFQNCTSLQSIVIPEGVTSISSAAFQNCTSLQSIVIPEGVTSIISNSFYNCPSLQSIVISKGVTKIDGYAFQNCTSLQSITCESLTAPTIQNYTFPQSSFKYSKRYLYIHKDADIETYTSGNWKTYLIDKGWELRYIEDREKTPTTLKLKTKNNFFHNLQAIGQANLVDYELIDNEYIYNFDDKITELTQYIFYHKVLEEIVIPEGVTSIGRYAFHQCNRLQSVTIPDSVTSIEERAFYQCSALQSIVIPEGVTSIENSAFTNCYSLQSIICLNPTAPTITSGSFSYIGTQLPSDAPKVLRIPQGSSGYEEETSEWYKQLIAKGYTVEYI